MPRQWMVLQNQTEHQQMEKMTCLFSWSDKFDDFKYVYVTLSESTTQQQLRDLSKFALAELGEMVQKNRKLFEV